MKPEDDPMLDLCPFHNSLMCRKWILKYHVDQLFNEMLEILRLKKLVEFLNRLLKRLGF